MSTLLCIGWGSLPSAGEPPLERCDLAVLDRKFQITIQDRALEEGITYKCTVQSVSNGVAVSEWKDVPFPKAASIPEATSHDFFVLAPKNDRHPNALAFRDWFQLQGNVKDKDNRVLELLQVAATPVDIWVTIDGPDTAKAKGHKFTVFGVQLNIGQPADGSRLAYDTSSRLFIPCWHSPSIGTWNSSVGPVGDYLNRMETQWIVGSIDDSHGAKKNVRIDWRQSLAVDKNAGDASVSTTRGRFDNAATFTGLPAQNSEFGDKAGKRTLELKAPKNLTLNKSVRWAALFPALTKCQKVKLRDRNGNLKADSEQVANWYYYWADEDADKVCDYSRDAASDRFVSIQDTRWDEEAQTEVPMVGGLYYENGRSSDNPAAKDVIFIGTQIVDAWDHRFPIDSNPLAGKQLAFSFRIATRTNMVNATVAHERTHRKCFRATPRVQGGNDRDGDRVPDDWEREVGLDPSTDTTFNLTRFNGSPTYRRRDQEWYAWLSTAFGADGFEGRVADAAGKDVKKDKQGIYTGETDAAKGGGVVPTTSKHDLDWSVGGFQARRP